MFRSIQSKVILLFAGIAAVSGSLLAITLYEKSISEQIARQAVVLNIENHIIESVGRKALQINILTTGETDSSFEIQNYARETALQIGLVRNIHAALEKGGRVDIRGESVWIPALPTENQKSVRDLDLLVNALENVHEALIQKTLAQRNDKLNLLASIISRLSTKNLKLLHHLETQSAALAARSSAAQSAQAAASILFFIAVFFLIAFSVLRPLRALRRHLNHLGEVEGDLTVRLPVLRRDELGAIAESFNRFAGKLQTIFSELKDSMKEISEAAAQVSSSTARVADTVQEQAASHEEITSSVEEISGSAEHVTATTRQQVEQVVALAAKSAQLSSMISATGQRMEDAKGISSEIAREANAGSASLDEMSSSITRIQASSQRITEIAGIITDISDRINLLSLNAAIEAARAGDAGRGFAVVADEVSKLADKTQSSIKEINQLIDANAREIETGKNTMTSTVKTISQIINAVGTIVRITAEISEDVERESNIDREVSAGAQKLRELSGAIQTVIDEQRRGLTEIVTAVQAMSELSQRGASGTDMVREKTAHIAAMAQHLTSRADFFKV